MTGKRLEPGQRVVADGLGSFTLLSLDGETRRENLKVTLEVEREDGR